MIKAPIATEKSKKQIDNTKTPPKLSKNKTITIGTPAAVKTPWKHRKLLHKMNRKYIINL